MTVRRLDPASDLRRLLDLVSAEPPNWEHATARIGQRPTLITFVNPLSLATARSRPCFLDELAAFDQVYPDSILVARLARMLCGKPVARHSLDGNSLAPDLLAHCAAADLRFALVGGRKGIARAAGRVFAQAFGATPALCAAGYFADPAARTDLLHRLIVEADVVLCGMGSGVQERFLLDLASLGWCGLGVTCGGYLDQAAEGNARYYPRLVNSLHLRAAWRMIREPSRLVPRYTVAYMPFYYGTLAVMTRRAQIATLNSLS